MSSKRSYFKMAYGIEETEEKVYIEDVEKEAALLDGAGTELMAEEAANDKLMNTLVEDSKTVDEMYGIMEKGIETTDGINSDTEAVVTTAIEAILRRHGMKRHISLPKRPSLESFDSKKGRLQAAENLRVSLEGIFGKIKEGIVRLWKWLKDLWARFFGKNTEVKIETLEEMVQYVMNFLEKASEVKPFVFNWGARDPDNGGEKARGGAVVKIRDFINESGFDKYFKKLTEDYKKFTDCLDAIVEKNKARSTNLSDALENTRELNVFSEFRGYDEVSVENKSELMDAINLIHKKILPNLKEIVNKYKDPINDKMAAAENVIQQIAPGVDEAEKDRGVWGNILAKFGKEKPQDVLRIIRKQSAILTKDVNGLIETLKSMIKGIYKKIKAEHGSLDKE